MGMGDSRTPVSQAKQQPMMNADAILALERRQAELEARAAELDRREKEQQARMASYQAGPPPHNWPPLAPWCPCKPCVRQDFEADIPADCRWMAKMGYGLWLAYALLLLINMGGTLSYFIVGRMGAEGPLFGASILLVLVMPPLTFFGWHRPLYKALRHHLIRNLSFSGVGSKIARPIGFIYRSVEWSSRNKGPGACPAKPSEKPHLVYNRES
ncbi:unnamed protein product [Echinostoma caproni]|uniref:Secretory carrier-associated membrane protein n=1 Tax=Echinostoma caproni TaxID=27848 RepID=A0A183AZT1_9TREM|nr:unnamed protein product [Echinostoma caproni]